MASRVRQQILKCLPVGTADGAGMKPSVRRKHILEATFETCKRSAWDPAYRLEDQERDGIVDGLSKLPSEYLRSNVWTTFQDDWVAFATTDLMSYTQLLWANDFPHTDSTWPHSQELLAKHAANLSEAERKAILRNNVRAVFQLPVPAA